MKKNVKDGEGSAPYRSKKPVQFPVIDEHRITTPSCVYATPVSSDSFYESIIFLNNDRPNRAAANFSIPVTSDLVHFFNNGSVSRSFGFIRITASEERRSDIQVDVSISYENVDVLNTTKLCLVEEKAGEMGVGILVRIFDSQFKSTSLMITESFQLLIELWARNKFDLTWTSYYLPL